MLSKCDIGQDLATMSYKSSNNGRLIGRKRYILLQCRNHNAGLARCTMEIPIPVGQVS
jgi:hypothetical protein